MKPTLKSPELGPLLAFGAHPDDIEFGCGGVIASETHAGRKVHFVVCSRGEAGTHGKLVRDAARLARYGGLKELPASPPHSIQQLFFYAVPPEAEPNNITPILFDISAPELVTVWMAGMEAHATQVSARNYIEIQLARSRLLGARIGRSHAIVLFPNDPLVFGSLAQVGMGARGL